MYQYGACITKFRVLFRMFHESNHIGRWLSETCLCSLLWPKKIKFRIFYDLSLHIFQKKYFCGCPHEIYFRYPVRRKQNYIFFWPHTSPVFFNLVFNLISASLCLSVILQPASSSQLPQSLFESHFKLSATHFSPPHQKLPRLQGSGQYWFTSPAHSR